METCNVNKWRHFRNNFIKEEKTLTPWNIGYVMKYKIIRARHSRVSNKLSRLETLSS